MEKSEYYCLVVLASQSSCLRSTARILGVDWDKIINPKRIVKRGGEGSEDTRKPKSKLLDN